MTLGDLSDSDLEMVRKITINQISFAIDKLHYLRSELKEGHQYSDEQMLVVTLFLIYINKFFWQ